jgi:hypothetical protein
MKGQHKHNVRASERTSKRRRRARVSDDAATDQLLYLSCAPLRSLFPSPCAVFAHKTHRREITKKFICDTSRRAAGAHRDAPSEVAAAKVDQPTAQHAPTFVEVERLVLGVVEEGVLPAHQHPEQPHEQHTLRPEHRVGHFPAALIHAKQTKHRREFFCVCQNDRVSVLLSASAPRLAGGLTDCGELLAETKRTQRGAWQRQVTRSLAKEENRLTPRTTLAFGSPPSHAAQRPHAAAAVLPTTLALCWAGGGALARGSRVRSLAPPRRTHSISLAALYNMQ